MFFKKKKPKLDPKVRFQNRQFNQKLQEARTFKRNVKPIPEGEFSKFLKRIGMGSAWRQIGLGLFVLAILYIVYFPNFLTLKNFQIEGVRESDRATIEAVLRDNLAKVPFYNPQRNILFLSEARINKALSDINSVDSVAKISKNYKDKTLRVVLVPKQEKFLVRSNDRVFILYNDGSLKMEVDRSFWDTNPNVHLIKIDVPADITVNDNGKIFLTSDAVHYVSALRDSLKGIVGSSLAYISIPITDEEKKAQTISPTPEAPATTTTPTPDAVDTLVAEENSAASAGPTEKQPSIEIQTPVATDELNIYMQKGDNKDKTFKVLVDPKEDPRKFVDRLNLLLSQTAPDRYTNLSYIDLRIQNRAFVCLANTACSNSN